MIDPARPVGCSQRPCRAVVVASALGALMLVLAVVALAGSLGAAAWSTRASLSLAEPRVVVLKSKRQLHLFDGQQLVRTYPIDLGTSPVGRKRLRADGRTPVGRFRIVTKNCDSPFRRFLGIDYPDAQTVDWGFARGLVSRGEAESIRRAHEAGRCPDWGTALGGGIGIHGCSIGRDWTGGCIAVSDEHVDELFAVLRVGDPIEILP